MSRALRAVRYRLLKSSLAARCGWATLVGSSVVVSVVSVVCAGAARALPPTAAEALGLVPIDGVAAVVGGSGPGDPARTILRSDVELRARLSLMRHDPQRAVLGTLPSALLSATLEELLGEQLIAAEAERVQIAPPRPNEVALEKLAIEREAGGRGAVRELLEQLDASDRELTELARRRALIGAFLRANLEGATVVTEAEIDQRLHDEAVLGLAEPNVEALAATHSANGAASGARGGPAVPSADAPAAARAHAQLRATVRATIAKESLARNIERWVRVLRARTRVRVFAAYESP